MYCSIMPGYRVSRSVKPQLKILSTTSSGLAIFVKSEETVTQLLKTSLQASEDYQFISLDLKQFEGKIDIILEMDEGERRVFPYEVIDSPVRSTRLLDGCWISLVHWSDDEARMFNEELKNLDAAQWREQICSMNDLGIKGIVIQNVFDSTNYVFQHNESLQDYSGSAFYPSKLFPKRFPNLKIEDPLEVILSQADELGMQVFVGVGLFAWFDYSPDSLAWHKAVAKELHDMYGHHSSFYSYYISEELHGSFYDEYDPINKKKWTDVPRFFKEFAQYIKELDPTKPISMAPNNILFEQHAEKWLPTLENIDILLPFAFARDLDNLNIREIQNLCNQANTHFWVDMEIFDYPFDETGLVPKKYTDLLNEIKIYDEVENIFGYQYTGLLNNPESQTNLGGDQPKQLFEQYKKYLNNVQKGIFE